MNKNWNIYRLIILVVIIISFFFARTCRRDEPVNIPSTLPSINRNIKNLIYTKHAKCRMECREIDASEIKEILHDGKINYNKSKLNEMGDPTYALEGYSHDKQHLRIVFAQKTDALIVVTCIDLDKEWQCNCN